MKAGSCKTLAILAGGILSLALPSHGQTTSAILDGFNANTFNGGSVSAPGNDDGSTSLISLGFSINFSGVAKNSLYINNNGNVTFDSTLSTYTPFDLTTTNRQILAPFFGDVDTRNSSLVTYGTGTVNGHQAFGVNWVDVGYFSQANDKLNSFQLIIINRSDLGIGNWDFMFNYGQIEWETGDASGGTDGLGGHSARAGFSLPGTCLELPGSSYNGAFLDSGPSATALVENSLYSTVEGRYIFSVRGGVVTLPAPVTWQGGVDNLWTSANWYIQPQEGLDITTPAAYSDVLFSASGAANEATTLDADYSIKSLTVTSPNAVSISGTHTLTVFGTVGTTGIAVASGAGAFTINTPLILGGGSQKITVNNTAGMFINGSVGGTIGLEKWGVGTLTLTNTNTYTGNTTVHEGMLVLGGSANIPTSGTIAIHTGGALVVDTSASATWNQNIVNDGAVVFVGSAFGTYTVTGDVSGTGYLAKSGSNILVLSGSQSYTGGTLVAEGILRLDGSNSLPTGSLVQVNAGATFDMGDYSQELPQVVGDGTVLTGSNSILSLGANDTSSNFTGSVTGLGTIQKIGSGTVNLTGTFASTTPTSVLGGTLLVNGLVQGDVRVLAGTLGGSGIINGNLLNQARVSPGNSPGVIFVSGNYDQTVDGALAIQLATKTSYDQLIVGGTATLGGTLEISRIGKSQLRGTTYAIVLAGEEVSGTFTSIVNTTGVKFNVLYEGDTVLLQPFYRIFSDVPGLTPNERAVAKAFDRIIDDGKLNKSRSLTTLADTLNAVPTAQLPGAFEAIVPTDYILLPDATFALARVQTANLERRMEEIRSCLATFTTETSIPTTFYTANAATSGNGTRYIDASGRELAPAPLERRLSFFLNGSGNEVDDKTSTIDGNGKFSTGGVSAGADYRFNDNFAAGLTLGYANTNTTGRGDGSVDIDSGNLAAYATAFSDGFYANGILGIGSSDYSARRESLGGIAHGDTSGLNFTALLGGGYSFTQGGFSAGPIASVRYVGVQIDGFSERGSLAPLEIRDQSKSSVQTTLGFQVSCEIPVASALLKPLGRVQWRHEFSNDDRSVDAAFPAGTPFTVSAPSLGSDGILLDIGATLQLTPMVGVYAYYSGDIGASSYTSNAFFGGLQFSF